MLIKFMDVDYRQPLEPIYVDARYEWLFVIVRWGYRPLGMVRLRCQPHTRTVTVHELEHEILQNFGWQLWEGKVAGTLDSLHQPEQLLPPISVIVCTRDRPLSLARCLQALRQLDYPCYEVVVVDNCSHNLAVSDVVAQNGFRYVREDRPGLDWARNRGYQEARHEIVAYIDDDALATPGWLCGVALAFTTPGVMVVTGLVAPAEMDTPAQHDFERYGGMNKGYTPFSIHRNGLTPKTRFWASNWGVGANMAFRRSLFAQIGGFDIALDVGTPTNGAGDLEMFYRAVSAGYLLRYEPAAMVYHVHRRDFTSLERQIYNNGRSFPAYLLTIMRKEPDQRRAVVRFAVQWWLWAWLVRRLLTSLIQRDQWTRHYAWTELKGALRALAAYRQAQHLAAQQLQAAPGADAASGWQLSQPKFS